jgi:hypothetical protein
MASRKKDSDFVPDDDEEMEDIESISEEEETEVYSAEDIETGLTRLCDYIVQRKGKQVCLNIDGNATGSCSCAFRMQKVRDGRGEGRRIIAAWFTSTLTVEEKAKKKGRKSCFLSYRDI